jgi:hypothetical protein
MIRIAFRCRTDTRFRLDWDAQLTILVQYSKWEWNSEKYRVLKHFGGSKLLTLLKIKLARESVSSMDNEHYSGD